MTENIAPPPAEHVLDATGHMHVVDAPIDLSHYTLEAWISLAFFWVLASDIFYQFFTRYLLICTVFIAIAASVRTDRHIHVDFFYRLLPAPVCRVLSTLVDLIRVAFFAYAVYLTWAMMQKMGNYNMTIVDLPMNTVYGVCLLGFAFAAVRAVQVL